MRFVVAIHAERMRFLRWFWVLLLVVLTSCGLPVDLDERYGCVDVLLARIDRQLAVSAQECRASTGELLGAQAAEERLHRVTWTSVRDPEDFVSATVYRTAEDPMMQRAVTVQLARPELVRRYGPPTGELVVERERNRGELLWLLMPVLVVGWFASVVWALVRARRAGVVVLWLRR